jgi:transcription initiation factor TFIIIB Brf1 subunit/transcription initiation factor TFIIB
MTQNTPISLCAHTRPREAMPKPVRRAINRLAHKLALQHEIQQQARLTELARQWRDDGLSVSEIAAKLADSEPL